MNIDPFEIAVSAHDRIAEQLFPGIWVGAEPTFTLNRSESPEWLSEALGDEKLALAKHMMQALAQRHKTAVVLRSVGRQYDGEARPRWSLGIYLRRDGTSVWQGPPDPLGAAVSAGPSVSSDAGEPAPALQAALARSLGDAGWPGRCFTAAAALPARVLARPGARAALRDLADRPELNRLPLHQQPTPTQGLSDELAAGGEYLFCVGIDDEEPGCLCIELPRFAGVDDFLHGLDAIARACASAGVRNLILRGHPPPVDARVAWSTLTPDPAVIEVNLAPCPDLAGFLRSSREIHAVAAESGLAPTRMHYNGAISDSGGGGQITFGGTSAANSPFFTAPDLLPQLIVYVNNHPSLSYLFATDYVGGGSQSPRPDEGIREQFNELETALDLYRAKAKVTPEQIWRSFAPFMADPSGNSHRSELNIEKLWNPGLPGRGCLGLVEFRALRMSPTPEHATAVAALLHSIIVMLSQKPERGRLIRWGDALHDRFALPYFLRQDLERVLNELTQHGCGLAPALAGQLQTTGLASLWRREFAGVALEIEKAVEFWPLVGDVASQESVGSRLVDASTRRLQILLRALDASVALDQWRLHVQGHAVPMVASSDAAGELRLIGIRYREFKPWIGLHPQLEAHNPICIQLSHPRLDTALQAQLFNWQPQGMPYAQLPASADEADRRREERLVTTTIGADRISTATPTALHGEYCVDLRRL